MLAKKIKKNGLKWFWVRLKSEIHHPTKKISKFVMNFFAFQTKLFIYRDNKNYENLIAIYDLEVSPITYDFVTYLAFAEIEAVSLGFKGFEIVVIPKEKKFVTETIYSEIVNTDEMNWRIKNIILDSTLLSKKCLGIYFPQKRQQAFDYIEGKTLCPSLYTPFHLRVYDAREFYNRSKNEIFQGLCPSPYAQSLLDVWL